MALAIAVLIGGFTWIYVALDPWVRDFAGAVEARPVRTPQERAEKTGADKERTPSPTPVPTEPRTLSATEPTATAADAEQPTESDDDLFQPDYRVVSVQPVRLRAGPSVQSAIVIDGLPPGTALRFLGEREASSNPAVDGDLEWLHFRVETGQEGWIRRIDVQEQP
ncbi:MAG: SH3 domain-containing protein [Chloroflexota bacterium]|nr:SH3 domain-containing protein [Chloroflexota bacterium]